MRAQWEWVLVLLLLNKMKKYTISIEGMHCASCASNIERSLKKVPGVKSASISLIFKKGSVEAEDKVNLEQIKEAVSRTGYKITSIKG